MQYLLLKLQRWHLQESYFTSMDFPEKTVFLSFTCFSTNIIEIFQKDPKPESTFSKDETHAVRIFYSNERRRLLVITSSAAYFLEEAKSIEAKNMTEFFLQ